jgi:putative nucleotidyltransferase with HDIG domain
MQKKRRVIQVITKALYLVWSLLLTIILFIIIERTYSYAEYIARQNAMTMVSKDIVYRNWVASHGGVYVPVDEKTPPNPYLAHIKDRDIKAVGRNYTLMNPAYTLRQMMKEYTSEYGVETKITSKKLINPINRPDDWETIALNKIETTRKIYSELSKNDSGYYLRLMAPLETKKGCLKCHAFQGYKVGDIRGGVSVSIPMEPLYHDAFRSSMLVFSLFLIVWVVGMVAIYLFSRKIYSYIDEKELMYEEYIYGLVSVVEKRDTYTAGHSTRVADYAELIAKEMGLGEYDIHKIHRAGMLHDIGKVAIPDSVFLKPTKLTSNEYKMIQEHVEISYDMLKNISIFDDIKEIVRDHHEHYDGSGYPRGLSGDDIPLLAHILTLADSFDAMTTDRIYKGRKSKAQALREIAKLSSKQFHPDVVKAALVALKDVEINQRGTQKPSTPIEKERFSYFYKDPLTTALNENYLRSHIKNISDAEALLWISLKEFHSYNKVHGWSSGDDVLKQIVNIADYSSDIKVYRFFGDNFLYTFSTIEELEKINKELSKLFDEKDIKYSVKISTRNSRDIKDVEILEDALDKLF